jgi:hypothetical protein
MDRINLKEGHWHDHGVGRRVLMKMENPRKGEEGETLS